MAFGTSTAITFATGVASASGSTNGVMKLYKAETASISVTSAGLSSTAASVTVSAAAGSGLVLNAASTTPTAGAADNLGLIATDTYGNTATSVSGQVPVTFSGAHSIGPNNPTVTSSSGVATQFGTATMLSFNNGVSTVSGSNNGVTTLYKVETVPITATAGAATSNAVSVTVSPASAHGFSIAAATTTPAAGAQDNLTITALDTYGNTATGYTGSHGITFAGANSIGANNPTVTNSSGTAIAFGGSTSLGFASGWQAYSAQATAR